MALLTEINQMQTEGMTEPEIIEYLKGRGISSREIREALTQSKIKEAVGSSGKETGEMTGEYETSEKTIDTGNNIPIPGQTSQEAQLQQQPYPQNQPNEISPIQQQEEYSQSQTAQANQQPQYQEQQYQQDYPQQYQQQGGISSDTLTEIAEQVVSEKLSPLREDIEKIIDLKTTSEAKLSSLDERLKRIEKIIDRLQLSIMQKVGDYMSNIEDIKKEIQETQKSFKSMSQPQTKKTENPKK